MWTFSFSHLQIGDGRFRDTKTDVECLASFPLKALRGERMKPTGKRRKIQFYSRSLGFQLNKNKEFKKK